MSRVARLTQEMRIEAYKIKDEKIRREINLVIEKINFNKQKNNYSKDQLIKDLEVIVDFSYFDI